MGVEGPQEVVDFVLRWPAMRRSSHAVLAQPGPLQRGRAC